MRPDDYDGPMPRKAVRCSFNCLDASGCPDCGLDAPEDVEDDAPPSVCRVWLVGADASTAVQVDVDACDTAMDAAVAFAFEEFEAGRASSRVEVMVRFDGEAPVRVAVEAVVRFEAHAVRTSSRAA